MGVSFWRPMPAWPPIRYVREVVRPERLERLRALDPFTVDAVAAVVVFGFGLATVFSQDLRDGARDPGPLAVLTAFVICAPIAVRRRWPLGALTVSVIGIFLHILANWSEGSLPAAVLILTYSVGAHRRLPVAVAGVAMTATVIVVLALVDSPGLDVVGTLGVLANFAAAWAIGVALRNRRLATDARVSEANERAEAARESSARALAEERLRIAQELHDVVAHSMSVIAVQAGAGMHVLDEHPDQARAALEAISATSRGTLAEMRRLLGVLRDSGGARATAPAPGLDDLPELIDEVRAAGVPAALHVDGVPEVVPAGVGLSAYRVVQEALTNVIKHAGQPTRVDVTVRHGPGALTVEIVDDGRGLAARSNGDGGHGLVGMRERVEVWGGELSVGPARGGGYRVAAVLPYEGAG